MQSNTRKHMGKVQIFVCLVLFLFIAIGKVAADGTIEEGKLEVVQEVTLVPSDMDKDWPIVRIERTEEFDSVTETKYVSILIVRQSSMGSATSNKDSACMETTSLANCVKVDVASFYQTGTRSSSTGWITSHVKHYADVICNGSDCVYKKPTKLETWWTRSGSNWRVTGAYAGWGCVGCVKCGGGAWQTVWIESPSYTPGWVNNTTSYTYTYTSTSYPGLYPYDSTTDRASMDSDAYEGWTFRGHMSVNPGFG